MITCIPQTSQVSLFINKAQSHKFASKGFTSSTTFDPPPFIFKPSSNKENLLNMYFSDLLSESWRRRFLKRFILVLSCQQPFECRFCCLSSTLQALLTLTWPDHHSNAWQTHTHKHGACPLLDEQAVEHSSWLLDWGTVRLQTSVAIETPVLSPKSPQGHSCCLLLCW